MNYVGFDLGSSSLKLLEVVNEGGKLKAVQAFEYTNPFGLALPTDEAQLKQLATMLKQVLTQHNVSVGSVRTAIPESLISTKIISTPPLSDAELASAIDWLAEQHIAIPLEEAKIEYEVLYRPGADKKDENMRVMIIGVPKKVIEAQMHLFELAEIEPVLLETQTVSLVRAVATDQMPTTLIVNM